MGTKSNLTVVGAAIMREGKLLALKRKENPTDAGNKYVFVSGTVEGDESHEQALKRECRQQLSLEVEVGDLINQFDYDYPTATVHLSVYLAKPLSDYEIKRNKRVIWLDCSALDANDWAAADRPFIPTIKKGFTKLRVAKTDEDYAIISKMAGTILREVYNDTSAEGLTSYVLKSNFSTTAISASVASGFKYLIACLNGEDVGFFAHQPASQYSESYKTGTYLAFAYIKKFARDKKMLTNLLPALARPVYLKVRRDNVQAVNMFKRSGFNILQSVNTDLGSGYTSEDFLMILN